MTNRDGDLERRYGAARSNVSASAPDMQKASAATLAKLMLLPLDDRVALFTKPLNADLIPEDLSKLANSLRDNSPAKRAVTSRPANRWAIWRSRVRYRIASFAILGFSIVCAGALADLRQFGSSSI